MNKNTKKILNSESVSESEQKSDCDSEIYLPRSHVANFHTKINTLGSQLYKVTAEKNVLSFKCDKMKSHINKIRNENEILQNENNTLKNKKRYNYNSSQFKMIDEKEWRRKYDEYYTELINQATKELFDDGID